MRLAVLLLLLALVQGVLCARDLFCEDMTCYERLGVDRESSARQIKKAFYKLSLEYHPDRNKQADAEDMFRKIATAYEVLKDPDSRADYNFALDHPEKVLRNTYFYYRHKLGGTFSAPRVILVFVLIITVLEQLYWRHRYRVIRDDLSGHRRVVGRMRAEASLLMQKDLANGTPLELPGGTADRKGKSGKKNRGGMTRKQRSALLDVYVAREMEKVEKYVDIHGHYEKRLPVMPWDLLPVRVAVGVWTAVCILVGSRSRAAT